MGWMKKALLASTISLCSLLTPSVVGARDPCYNEGTCGDEEQIPPIPPGSVPPGPVPPEPQPTGIYSTLAGAFNMNPLGVQDQIYTVGWSSAPNGYHPILANDASQDGIIRYGGYNKTITHRGPNALGEAEYSFIKSPQGLGEIFVFTNDSARITLEEMDWYHNDWYRTLHNEEKTEGLFWAKFGLPSGTDVIEKGTLDYYRCAPGGVAGPGQYFESHDTYAMNRLYGPYDISTPEGMARARMDLAFIGNRDNPQAVPDSWKTFGAQLGHPNAHVMVYLLRDLWGPRDSRPITDISHWGNMEFYAYGEAVEPDNSWRRGLGLIGWGALDEHDYDFTGNFILYRQQIQTTIRHDNRTRMLQLCDDPNIPDASKAVWGVSSLATRVVDEPFLIPEGIESPQFPTTQWKKRPKWMRR